MGLVCPTPPKRGIPIITYFASTTFQWSIPQRHYKKVCHLSDEMPFCNISKTIDTLLTNKVECGIIIVANKKIMKGMLQMAKIGYIRVSTEEQETARQEQIMKNYGVEKVYLEKLSGKNTDRPEFQKMINFLREGDVLYVESISRLSRSIRDLLKTVDVLTEKGVALVSSKENIDTDTPQGRFMLSIFAALSELEREQTLQRQREGIEQAKKRGVYKGRQPIKVDEKRFREICKDWTTGKITAVKCMQILDLKANTFYRRVNEYGIEKPSKP